jgi:hypothetical protein
MKALITGLATNASQIVDLVPGGTIMTTIVKDSNNNIIDITDSCDKIREYIFKGTSQWILPGMWVDNSIGGNSNANTPDVVEYENFYEFVPTQLSDAELHNTSTIPSFTLPSTNYIDVNGTTITIPGITVPAQTVKTRKTWAEITSYVNSLNYVNPVLHGLVIPEFINGKFDQTGILVN